MKKDPATLERESELAESQMGTAQWILLEFPKSVEVSQLHIQFQGGFTSRTCTLEGCTKNEALEKIMNFYPEDNSALQRFSIPPKPLEKLKVIFENSTDFFGRIIIYHLDVLGKNL
ncbi:nuclear receptor 2C2-associated protein isoform X2 [Microcaecilia unicolor]|uniref:Nuclear receptor 2C2-associated protein isoform X2 n=1 Tax=Microcaecilia unicolor TaxID=1415580 RepID=A0A6P7Z9H3_9AMPH|nr:nuclear receptor 2C2-associated protein isoform X2 [Microcaecilia unicolor]